MLTDKQVREKLIHQGVRALNDAELMSLLLQKGENGGSALELAEHLLTHFGGNLLELARCEPARLRGVENLGVSRAVLLTAALELGRRCRTGEGEQCETIRSEQDLIALFQPQLAGLPYEEMWAVYLNTSNRILDKVRVSQGGVAQTPVDARLVVKRAVSCLAQGILLVHNHPSGNPIPSEEDRLVTEKVCRAASLFDITLLDHLIVTTGECYSFRAHGFFDQP